MVYSSSSPIDDAHLSSTIIAVIVILLTLLILTILMVIIIYRKRRLRQRNQNSGELTCSSAASKIFVGLVDRIYMYMVLYIIDSK